MSYVKIEEACGRYITHLGKQSPIVSYSHHYLRGLYDAYGTDEVDAELKRQFAEGYSPQEDRTETGETS